MRKELRTFMIVSACCIASQSFSAVAADTNKQLVGVASIFDDAGWDTQKQYFHEVIGPALDMDFIFSGKLSNENELTDFMEKSIALGCTGIINMVTQDAAVTAGARLAEESDIWYVTQNSMISEDVAELEHNLGHVGASADGMEDAYRNLVTELIEQDGRKGFFIYTGSAVGGDSGTGASSHFHSVRGILEAIAGSYGLQYQVPVEELVNREESGYVETGNEDVTIYLSSGGVIMDGVEEAQRELASGKFDTLITVTSYSSFTGITDQIEKNTDENIMIVATVSDDQMTQAGFETMDVTGDSVIHAGVINPLSAANVRCSVLLSKGMNGLADTVKDAGHTVKYEVDPVVCYDAESYQQVIADIRKENEDILKE